MNPWKDRPASICSDAAKPLLLTGAVFAVAAALRNGLLDALGNNPTIAFTLAGSLVIYLATRPRLPAIAGTVLLGLLLRVVFGAAVGLRPYFGSWLIGSVGFMGMAALIVLAATAVRTRNIAPFARAAFFPSAAVVLGFFVPAMHLSRLTYDARLLAVDGAFGFQLSFLLGQMTSGSALLWQLTATVYYALPAASEIPVAPLAVPAAPRNAMPSLHVAGALLVFWNSLSLRKTARFAAGLFLLATAYSTLALGEHYLIDLVVAVPFTLIFHAAFSDARRTTAVWRHRAILGGALLSVGWLVFLRFWVQLLLGWPGAIGFLCLSTMGSRF